VSRAQWLQAVVSHKYQTAIDRRSKMNWVGWVLAFWNVVHSVVELILAGAIVYFAWASWHVASRLAWLTGAMESHSDIMTRLEAQKQKIPMVWWDPTAEMFPDDGVAHGKECRINKIAVGLPTHLRKHQGKQAEKRKKELRRKAREEYMHASDRT
jgi:hypothetical protein